ncbi:MAG: response regulator [Pyrinomonadaceae bacterium]
MGKTRIALVDDQRIVVEAIGKIVETEFEVIGTFDDPATFLKNVEKLRPDVAILDVGMPNMNGFALARHVKKLVPKTKLIFLTMYRDREQAAEAFQLGASGYVLKSAAAKDLIEALREVVRGGYYASPKLTEGMVGSFVQGFKKMKKPRTLTDRQKEFLQLYLEGLGMKQIASTMNITVRTVAFHKYSIMEQHRITSNAELINFARESLPTADPLAKSAEI